MKTVLIFSIGLAGMFSTALSVAQTSPTSTRPNRATEITQSTVLLNESFDSLAVGSPPIGARLERAKLVSIVAGGGRLGSGNVAYFNDDELAEGGALEYNVGDAALSNLSIEFDARNNDSTKGDKKSSVIFAVGPWKSGKDLTLNAKSTRAFGFEMYQQKTLRLRVGDESICKVNYDSASPFNVKIWVNDHDAVPLSYARPDNGQTAELNPNSVVVWINNALMKNLQATGTPMHRQVTEGNAVIGRVGLSSASTKVADFLFDNLRVQSDIGPSTPVPSDASTPSSANNADAQDSMGSPGAPQATRYRTDAGGWELLVYHPNKLTNLESGEPRSAFLFFPGSAGSAGNAPNSSAETISPPQVQWALSHAMVGVVANARPENPSAASTRHSVNTGLEAFTWLIDHADQLGIDVARIAVGGESTGGLIALSTTIDQSRVGSTVTTTATPKPAALFLTSAFTDTSQSHDRRTKPSGDNRSALSNLHHLHTQMPPTLIFHAAFDNQVHYRTAVALCNKLQSANSVCELVTVPVGGHDFLKESPHWQAKQQRRLQEFFARQGLLPAIK